MRCVEEALKVKEDMMDLTVQKWLQASTEQWQGDIVSAVGASGELKQERLLDAPAETRKIAGTFPYMRELSHNATELEKAGCTAKDLATAGYKAQEFEMAAGKSRQLPPEFWEANKFNVRGGVEYGFMSTTTPEPLCFCRRGGGGSWPSG